MKNLDKLTKLFIKELRKRGRWNINSTGRAQIKDVLAYPVAEGFLANPVNEEEVNTQ